MKIITKYTAFTLAEVLITLGIIGIVASMTIPTLMANSQKAEIVTAVYKYQSVFNEAVKRYALDNGCIGDLASCGDFDDGALSQTERNNVIWGKLSLYFSIAKNCGTNAGEGCWAKGVVYPYLNSSLTAQTPAFDDRTDAKAVLADGTSIFVFDQAGNCTSDVSRSHSAPLNTTCAEFYADVNGAKPPNQFGKDTFCWRIAKNGVVYPFGSLDDTSTNATTNEPLCDASAAATAGGAGYGCAAKVLKEGKISYY